MEWTNKKLFVEQCVVVAQFVRCLLVCILGVFRVPTLGTLEVKTHFDIKKRTPLVNKHNHRRY